jgi:hypothetical protein
MIKFAILSEARSGTSFLTSALQQHPDVLMHGEIFHPRVEWHINSQVLENLDFDLDQRKEKPIEFIENIYQNNAGKSVVGFKIWHSQSHQGVQYIIENKNIKKIILERENCLASFSSRLIAEKTKIYNMTNRGKNNNYQTPEIEFDEHRFHKYVEFCQKTFNFYKNEITKNGQDYLLLTYTDNIMSNNLQMIYDFLQIDPSFALQGDKVKLNQQNNMLERFIEKDRHKIIECLQNLGKQEWIYENPLNTQ